MNGILIIGTGGAGGAIASYINSLPHNTFPICLIDSGNAYRATTPPLFQLNESVVDSQQYFNEFLRSIVSQYQPQRLVILTGFIGKKTAQLIQRFHSYCEEQNLALCVAGVTPFRFEGRKKEREAQSCITKLHELNIPVIIFSNSDLLEQVTAELPIEQAVTINYERIFQAITTYSQEPTQPVIRVEHKPTLSQQFQPRKIQQVPMTQLPKSTISRIVIVVASILAGMTGATIAWFISL